MLAYLEDCTFSKGFTKNIGNLYVYTFLLNIRPGRKTSYGFSSSTEIEYILLISVCSNRIKVIAVYICIEKNCVTDMKTN